MKLLKNPGTWVLAVSVLAVAAIVGARHQDRPATPDTAIVTEARAMPANVTSVVLDGPIDLTLRQGAQPALSVRAEARLLPNVATTVDGDRLRIGPTGMLLRPRQTIAVQVTLPALLAARIGGSGDTTVAGFDGDHVELALTGSGSLRFTGRYRSAALTLQGSGELAFDGGALDTIALDAAGSGDVALAGSTHTLRVSQRGSGTLDAGDLRADDVTLLQQGSGESSIDARRTVRIELHGSGDVTVSGNPAGRSVQRVGSGNVQFDQ